MEPILVKDRKTGSLIKEQVFGALALKILYTRPQCCIRNFVSKNSFISKVYGWWQKQPWTKASVNKFIKNYHIDSKEFAKNKFDSFNDFFTRELKEECRPLSYGERVAIMPADGRYFFFQKIDEETCFNVKSSPMNLEKLLQDKELAARFKEGSMVISRLCPVDYHRFHFPCDGKASPAYPIKGPLYSVNPWALKKDPSILWENKRVITFLESEAFGTILYIEVGATCVGTIHQTYQTGAVVKGQEKGYFSFGGSCLILLFEKGRIAFDADLLSSGPLEIYCQMGESLGQAPSK